MYSHLQNEAMEFENKLNTLMDIMRLDHSDLRNEFINHFKLWSQSTPYSLPDSLAICKERYLNGFSMPWEV